METVRPMVVVPKEGKLRRKFAKVLNIHKLMGVAPEEEMKKIKFDSKTANLTESFYKLEEEYERSLALEALLAKLFATVSSIKAAYAQLQHCQSPYDSIGIQKSDNLVVAELKTLSELKQCFLKKQVDPNPERTLVLAEIQELRSLLKTYEIMGKKLESQYKLKDSEIVFLREKLDESMKQNKLTEKRLNQSGQLCNPLDNLHLSALNPTHFVTYLHHTVKSTRGFVKLMIEQMKTAGWDISSAASSIQPGVFYHKQDHKCFTFEHFVSNVMFEAFHLPYFSTSSNDSRSYKKKKQSKAEREMFFERFKELRSMKAKDYLTARPKSRFARFCRGKYLQLIHPKMEQAFFGHLHLRNQVSGGEFPETSLFSGFLEMAKRIWLLHCLAYSFEPEAEIFRVPKGCRFSEVYMKSVTEEAFFQASESSPESEPRVAFTVVPGFRIGKTSIQCEVYLSVS
ncbi:PREDICTED: IRK-interacting protein-like [Camelina sativa]|uniref:IRK-interacting protein-like n=1 Tax=Camelina sativa TaxID=90675 RepID=A0ABM0VWT4_CAMSA|nr:PREDICTED: IRK-interacting protein-like [Camelina sativa]XP_010462225.1 PREDICTED: IRK-interacting protein-like [Camelina sativa]XP_010462226.1 PREDICTED: IRK-interacting protein-like [Camelina sativa]